MAKSKRKINRLKRKLKDQKVKLRIPVAPPSISMKCKKDYNRKQQKQQLNKDLNENNY
jgi:hypothetical protein